MEITLLHHLPQREPANLILGKNALNNVYENYNSSMKYCLSLSLSLSLSFSLPVPNPVQMLWLFI
jgi:hypothetical protein